MASSFHDPSIPDKLLYILKLSFPTNSMKMGWPIEVLHKAPKFAKENYWPLIEQNDISVMAWFCDRNFQQKCDSDLILLDE